MQPRVSEADGVAWFDVEEGLDDGVRGERRTEVHKEGKHPEGVAVLVREVAIEAQAPTEVDRGADERTEGAE